MVPTLSSQKTKTMATIILNHRVKDYDSWKPLYDSDKARRDGAGLREIAVGQKAGDPGNVYLIWEAADTSIISKMMSDPDLQKKMQEGGVISEPQVTIIE
jgi:hypothetical protein